MKLVKQPVGFDWDKGNRGKSWLKHKVKDEECEEVFFDPDKKLLDDVLHATPRETRYILIGRTKRQRLLFISFTIRNNKVRIISACDIHTKSQERKLYEKET